VALLLANGADVNAQTDVRYVTSYGGQSHYGESPLTLALQSYYHKEVVELLLTHGADVNVELSNGDTPLSMAIDQNLPHDVQVLLANGANPDYAIMNGQTAVHRAVIKGRLEILKLLLDYGANPNAKDGRGYTPLHYIDVPVYGSYQESQSTGFDNKIVAVLVAHGGHK
jgi:ankyrin repeat protein